MRRIDDGNQVDLTKNISVEMSLEEMSMILAAINAPFYKMCESSVLGAYTSDARKMFNMDENDGDPTLGHRKYKLFEEIFGILKDEGVIE